MAISAGDEVRLRAVESFDQIASKAPGGTLGPYDLTWKLSQTETIDFCTRRVLQTVFLLLTWLLMLWKY